MVELRGLSVRLGRKRVLESVSFQWPRGLLAVVGANGSGKSTLLRALCGALEPAEGDARIDGFSLREQREEAQRRCALVPEEPSYPPHETVAELASLVAGLRRVAVPEDPRSRATLEQLGGQRYDTLSLGQRKRAHLLLARAGRPRWWLLDEPSDGLDQEARASLFEELGELEGGALVATHDPALIERCAGVLRVAQGRAERER